MERRIDLDNVDLDRAAEVIAARRGEWVSVGVIFDPLTWTDNEVEWPAPVVTDRGSVGRPRSLGIRVYGGGGAEAEVTLYAGGWADVAYVRSASTKVVQDYVELDSAEEFGALLDRVVAAVRSGHG